MFKPDILQKDIKKFYLITENILRKKNFAYSAIDFESLADKNHRKLGKLFEELSIGYDPKLSEEALSKSYNHCKRIVHNTIDTFNPMTTALTRESEEAT